MGLAGLAVIPCALVACVCALCDFLQQVSNRICNIFINLNIFFASYSFTFLITYLLRTYSITYLAILYLHIYLHASHSLATYFTHMIAYLLITYVCLFSYFVYLLT